MTINHLCFAVAFLLALPNVFSADADSSKKKFVVVAPAASGSDCKIIPETDFYAATFHKVFGPDSQEECQKWITGNCVRMNQTERSPGLAHEEAIDSVDSVRAILKKSKPPKLLLIAKGQTSTPGWTNPELKLTGLTNGIYYFEFVATSPVGIQLQIPTPILSTGIVTSAAADTRGATVSARSNSKTSIGGMLSKGTMGNTKR